jgi:predicted glycosyltransferase
VILTPANLDPRMRDGRMDQHIVMNAAEARAILEASGKVKLVVQGHCHGGAFTSLAGIDYVTLPAMVMGEHSNSAMIFSIQADGSYTCRQLFE